MVQDRILSSKLRALIELCTQNIEGLSKKRHIEKLLPISEKNGLKIFIENEIMYIIFNDELRGRILLDADCYSNMKILRSITPIYNIELKNEDILEKIKYNYIIKHVLLRGESV